MAETDSRTDAGSSSAAPALLACPFCGNGDVVAFIHATENDCECGESMSGDCWAVNCNFNEGGCGATGGFRDTQDEAAALWNKGAGLGHQAVSEEAIAWLFENYREVYDQFYERL